MNDFLQRISIVGCSGSGKTTLGRDLAHRLSIPAVDLDELCWLPDWQTREQTEFRTLVRHQLRQENWVISGNYSRLRPEIWARAQTVIWLDYSFFIVMRRLIQRTFRRVALSQSCCNGNRETWGGVFSRDSVVLYGLKTYLKRRREYAALLSHPDCAHLQILRFRSPFRTRDWLLQI